MTEKTVENEECQILHFTLGENAGKLLVDVARQIAYTRSFEEGLKYLDDAGIYKSDICEEILYGRLTLAVKTTEEGQYFQTVPDDWKPPKKKTD